MQYTQKDVCRAFDIKRDTLRHYERLGIIEPQVDEGNGYRYYDDWQINLLWDCKRYQAMGSSLAEIRDILHRNTLSDVEGMVDDRLLEMERQLRYQEMALRSMHEYREALHGVEGRMGRFLIRELPEVRFVARREVHDLLLDDRLNESGKFVNSNQPVCLPPMAYFPNAWAEQYFWGFSMRADYYELLGGPSEGSIFLPGGRALTTCVDAGERWGFGQRLFVDLLNEAERLGEQPAGPLYGYLLTRTYDEAGSYHRYVEACLPLRD